MEKKYRSCYWLEHGFVCYPSNLTCCCFPKSPVLGSAKDNVVDMVDDFLTARERLIEANQGDNPPCAGCRVFREEYTPTDKKIMTFNFSTHSYCQFSCTYCTLQQNPETKNQKEKYDAIAIATELKRRGMLADKLRVVCSPGEIAIHPNKEAYYDFIEENADTVTFCSNAAKYDERLAKILSRSMQNQLLVSMDCGTAETFKMVKGIDLYEKVKENLKKYREATSQIFLKYILLDCNCNEEDLDGFIELCSSLQVERFEISADLRRKTDYINATVPEQEIVNAAVRLIKGAIENQLEFVIYKKFIGNANLEAIKNALSDEIEAGCITIEQIL